MMVVNREQYVCDGVSTEAAGLRDLFLRGGAIYGTVFHDCATGTVLFMRGDVACAEQAFERARRCAIELHGEDSRLAAMPTTTTLKPIPSGEASWMNPMGLSNAKRMTMLTI